MSYIITDGQNYLIDHTGKGLTTVKRKAHSWKNTNAACNALHLLQNSKIFMYWKMEIYWMPVKGYQK